MRFVALPSVVRALLIGVVTTSAVPAAATTDLALVRIRVPAHVKLSNARPKTTAHAVVRIENRGTEPVAIGDAAALAAVVTLRAESLDGPTACPPLAIAPVVARVRFPLALRPGRGRTLRYALGFECGANPDRTADWTFSATVVHATDGDPSNDACPRPASASDQGCGPEAGPLATDVRDTRAGTRFELPGRYGVGTTSLALVDSSRPTIANGTFPGAPDRTLPTAVWYPTAPDAGGVDAPLANDGRPFPLIVFGHALGSYNTQSMLITEHLASHGYIVAAPAFPLSKIGAPGGSTIADVPGQAGDVSFVIDTLLGYAAETGNRFAGGVDAERIGMTGHSGGAITTLVATYDAGVHDPRIKAAAPLAPPSCFFQAGYFDTARVPLLIVQGDRDLLVDVDGDAGALYARAQSPKTLLVVHGGTHLGFADVGASLGDGVVCSLFPDRTDLNAEIATFMAALGGAADHLSFDGCPSAYCVGDGTRPGGLRQLQVGKEATLAFFEDVLRGDRAARRYLSTLAARNSDLTLTQAR